MRIRKEITLDDIIIIISFFLIFKISGELVYSLVDYFVISFLMIVVNLNP